MLKRLTSLILAVVFVFAIGAAVAEAPEVAAPEFTGPYVVTTCGQSPGAAMFQVLARLNGAVSVNDNSLSLDKFVTDGNKTLIVTTGTSGKGMGAAGTDVDGEIARCTALIEKAKEAGMTVVTAHVEGMARRTDSADQASIDNIMPLGDVMIVIADSDSDGLFTKISEENNIPLIVVPTALDLKAYLK